jgi:hypothetical protein
MTFTEFLMSIHEKNWRLTFNPDVLVGLPAPISVGDVPREDQMLVRLSDDENNHAQTLVSNDMIRAGVCLQMMTDDLLYALEQHRSNRPHAYYRRIGNVHRILFSDCDPNAPSRLNDARVARFKKRYKFTFVVCDGLALKTVDSSDSVCRRVAYDFGYQVSPAPDELPWTCDVCEIHMLDQVFRCGICVQEANDTIVTQEKIRARWLEDNEQRGDKLRRN